jgi:beta-glucanase (GH16 family)
MKKIILLALLAANLATAQNPKRKLVWQEDFKGSKLDESVWNYELGNGCPNICGWGNNERQSYTKDNHLLQKGNLIIEARKEAEKYTSTRITTKGKKEFQYGRIECRAKLPVGKGIWPAFWMLGANIDAKGWPKCGEIDILEYVGRDPHQVYTTLHTQDGHGDHGHGKKTGIPQIEQGFHVFAVDWSKDKMDFFVDEELVFTYNPQPRNEDSWPYDQPFYIIVNMAVGGNFGGPGVDDAIFPQSFIVDYIKVYQ